MFSSLESLIPNMKNPEFKIEIDNKSGRSELDDTNEKFSLPSRSNKRIGILLIITALLKKYPYPWKIDRKIKEKLLMYPSNFGVEELC